MTHSHTVAFTWY